MPIKKSKQEVKRESLTLDILQIDLADLAELSEAERFGLYQKPDGRGFTIGFPRNPDEHSGEGLPELGDREKIDQWQITFDIRASFDHNEGKTFLEVARKGRGTFYSFDFEGKEFWKAQKASGRFNNSFGDFLIQYGIEQLFTSLYWQDSAKEICQDAYDAIITSFVNYFKLILKPKRKREIEKRQINPGVTITTYESIETGREPKTGAELDQEKSKFISDVFEALKQIESEGGKRTQLDVGTIIFEDSDSKDIQSLMKNRCRLYSLKWPDVLKEYERQKV
jgi:hypothetical protein